MCQSAPWPSSPITSSDEILRRERGLARDGDEHRDLWQRWMGEEAAFFAADGTRDRADLRVDASDR
ncbi:hypothetical protein DLJ46_27035 [Micromonospora globispora]|uniref:Uncharacterized protein n=1 Tax=Micromonospora globispora TaxID=1450148 RepID=A0A317JU56_9ACTN|nr:hypothetical protein [Micromonospora globispora]PWU44249.1 hypothetical protein DLJ46_27035 [Micromonospora globispora]RQW92757.1 hypothetical protein DKL51_18355 [Micromonospora globispora]